jgi:putative membrane protein
MGLIANILVVFVAVLHLGFLILEMFYWNHPVGRKTFRMTAEYAAASASLAANQGLYNGFLAAGLAWGLVTGIASIKIFFLLCVVIAGVFGALTAKRSILYLQAVPGFVALIAVYFSR